jgi:transcription elongation factor GreA
MQHIRESCSMFNIRVDPKIFEKFPGYAVLAVYAGGVTNGPSRYLSIAMLREELEGLKGQRGEIVESIRLAAADKDFRENAPLDAARENQGKTEARIREIEEMLRRAEIMDTTRDKSNCARVGATVVLQDLNTGKNVSYTLVDSTEADPTAGKISDVSPVGKAVMGRRKGEEVCVLAPKGERRYKVSSINF